MSPADFEGVELWHPRDEEADEVTCKFCGRGPFVWDHNGAGWFLASHGGEPHVCLKNDNAASPKDFE